MSTGSWVRITPIYARAVNAEIKAIINRKVESVTHNTELRRRIGEVYIQTVTKYVPYKTGKLISSAFTTSDGRVIWSAFNKGYDYAHIQYISTGFEHEEPRTAYWTYEVQPGTDDWDYVFIPKMRDLITKTYKNG